MTAPPPDKAEPTPKFSLVHLARLWCPGKIYVRLSNYSTGETVHIFRGATLQHLTAQPLPS
jgi:hypothetical protein